MLYDHYRVPLLHKIIEDFKKFLDIGKMKPCCRLIKKVKCLSRILFA